MPRLRMFAGPNGSGKSTIKSVVKPEWLGVYLNADDIERELRETRRLDLSLLAPDVDAASTLEAMANSGLALDKRLALYLADSRSQGSVIEFASLAPDSYFASALVERLRGELLERGVSHTFETVMSHPSKPEALERAQSLGFRTYLYFVATKDPGINVQRVAERQLAGGHGVPEDKIRERFWRSLDLLARAIKASNRAFLFDNSRTEVTHLAEIVDGRELILQSKTLPEWFERFVLDRLTLVY